MNRKSSARPFRLATILIAGLECISFPLNSWSLDVTQPVPLERRETVSLADAAVRALQSNLDINISRQTKESRLADITIEQSKFDPTLSVNGQYNRTVNPLNRPVFGGTLGSLEQIRIFDQRNHSLTVDASTNLLQAAISTSTTARQEAV